MREHWRLAALTAYYWATLAARKRRLRHWAIVGIAPVTILFYHRIHEDRATPWTTHPRAFLRQMHWLLERADLVSLQEAQKRLLAGNFSNRPVVAVTFDDGYEDNLRAALPFLIDHGVPCTYFVTVENVLRGRPFDHDARYGAAPRPHTPEQIRGLAESGVEIGSHAWSHCDFGQWNDDETRRQLGDSRHALEDMISAPVVRFAFPFGRPENAPPLAIAAARHSGYVAVCTAHGGYNVPPCEGFVLRRFHGDDPWIRMANRVTVDLRLLRRSAPALPDAVPAATPPEFAAEAAWAATPDRAAPAGAIPIQNALSSCLGPNDPISAPSSACQVAAYEDPCVESLRG
ncbi:MAG: polysaccharide deacetylase family protein [Thermogutta sp.]